MSYRIFNNNYLFKLYEDIMGDNYYIGRMTIIENSFNHNLYDEISISIIDFIKKDNYFISKSMVKEQSVFIEIGEDGYNEALIKAKGYVNSGYGILGFPQSIPADLEKIFSKIKRDTFSSLSMLNRVFKVPVVVKDKDILFTDGHIIGVKQFYVLDPKIYIEHYDVQNDIYDEFYDLLNIIHEEKINKITSQ